MDQVSTFQHKWNDSATKHAKFTNEAVIGDDTSLGLLPADAVENCTLSTMATHQNILNEDASGYGIFGFSRLQLPTPESKESFQLALDVLCSNPSQKLSKYPDQPHENSKSCTGSPNTSRPSSKTSNQDDSAETVIRNRSPQHSPRLMMFSPQLVETIPTHSLDLISINTESLN